jgi:hypothetical protein
LAAKPLPDFIAEREKNFNFKPLIDKLGGYKDTINRIKIQYSAMVTSLKENE